jgi:hypothetical protein
MAVDEEDSLGYKHAKLELEDSQKVVVLRREELVAVLKSYLHTNS